MPLTRDRALDDRHFEFRGVPSAGQADAERQARQDERRAADRLDAVAPRRLSGRAGRPMFAAVGGVAQLVEQGTFKGLRIIPAASAAVRPGPFPSGSRAVRCLAQSVQSAQPPAVCPQKCHQYVVDLSIGFHHVVLPEERVW